MTDEREEEIHQAMIRLDRTPGDIELLKHAVYQLRSENRELKAKLRELEPGLTKGRKGNRNDMV